MNRRLFSILAASFLVLPVSFHAVASSEMGESMGKNMGESSTLLARHGGKRGRGDRMEKLLQQLNLTPQQSEQIKTIRDRSEQQRATLHEEMSTQHQEMKSLFASETTSNQELTQKHKQIQSLHLELSNNRFDSMLEVREILTPEQRRQLAQLMQEHHSERRSRG